jgi:hypothetical protein
MQTFNIQYSTLNTQHSTLSKYPGRQQAPAKALMAKDGESADGRILSPHQ